MERTFKIINLTNLDTREKQDIVNILNETLTDCNMESGVKGVEYIIRNYARNKARHKESVQFYEDRIKQLEKELGNTKTEMFKHVAVSTGLKELLSNLKQVYP